MSNHSTAISIEKSLIEAFSDKPVAVILPIHLKLAGDYATAATLAQVLYWHKIMKKSFYKTDADFMAEMYLTIDQFKRIKSNLKKLPFLTIEVKGIPAKTFYDVNYQILAAEIHKINSQTTNNASWGENPQTVLGENPQTVLGENPQTVLGENPQTNTENTQRLHRDNNNQTAVVVEDELINKLFNGREKPAAKKLLAEVVPEAQQEVLDYMQHKIETQQIKSSKIGYLKTVIESVKNDTFTPLPAKAKPQTAAERIAKEIATAAEQEAQAKRSRAANDKRIAEEQNAKQATPAPIEPKRAKFGNLAI